MTVQSGWGRAGWRVAECGGVWRQFDPGGAQGVFAPNSAQITFRASCPYRGVGGSRLVIWVFQISLRRYGSERRSSSRSM